jgi:predicted GIY-YIG superfamily endonuclease
MAFAYILRCADDSLYVGHTDDLALRERAHNDGFASTYTAARRPVRMIYAEDHATIQKAIARERQIKRWSTDKKEALVNGGSSRLKGWAAKSRTRQGFTWRNLLEAKRTGQ